MITDAQCAEFCELIYHSENDHQWSTFDAGDDDGVCWAIQHTTDVDLIVLRGSATLEDWVRNFMALALPFTHHVLGPVHPGFLLGMEHAWFDMRSVLMPLPPRPVIVTGHSLGAARAAILAALMVAEGTMPPERLVCFASPKPGFGQLAELLSKIPTASYRNGFDGRHDPVTYLPLTFPPEDYMHTCRLTDVAQAPEPGDSLGIFALHRMTLYQQALQRLGPQP